MNKQTILKIIEQYKKEKDVDYIKLILQKPLLSITFGKKAEVEYNISYQALHITKTTTDTKNYEKYKEEYYVEPEKVLAIKIEYKVESI